MIIPWLSYYDPVSIPCLSHGLGPFQSTLVSKATRQVHGTRKGLPGQFDRTLMFTSAEIWSRNLQISIQSTRKNWINQWEKYRNMSQNMSEYVGHVRFTKKKNIVVHLCRVASRDDVVLIWDVIGGAQPAFGLVELRETSDLRPCITPQSKNKPKKYPQQQQLH